jgi:ubiquinone/menaquinone biosynthesis C-methylase UbiE
MSTPAYIMQDAAEPERIRRKTSDLLTRHHLDWAGLRAGQSFVDVGCASGEVVRVAAGLAGEARVVGVDGDSQMLAFAATESTRLGLSAIEYCQAWIGGLDAIPLAEGSFDHAWTRFFLEYQRQPEAVVAEMARLVRPGGKVTLLDLDGNCIWHYPLPAPLAAAIDEIVADLATTGFDPHVGRKLRDFATNAGLVDVRQAVEPYHAVVGRPDEAQADAWRRKLQGLKRNYVSRLFPAKADRAHVFDDLLEFILRDETMTWSLLYMVQGTRPA